MWQNVNIILINNFGMQLSEADIIKRGKIKNVILALDDGDAHYPSGHWANTTGTRMYSLSRVEIAESLIDNFSNGLYFHENASAINKMSTPVTEPYIIFDYRIIAEEILNLFESESRPLVTSPFMSFETSVKKRRPFVLLDFINISNYAFPNKKISNENELCNLLDEIAEESLTLFPKPWPDAIARIQVMKKNIFSGKSRNAARKILAILSFLRKNIINTEHIFKDTNDFFEALTAYPIIRIDHKVNEI